MILTRTEMEKMSTLALITILYYASYVAYFERFNNRYVKKSTRISNKAETDSNIAKKTIEGNLQILPSSNNTNAIILERLKQASNANKSRISKGTLKDEIGWIKLVHENSGISLHLTFANGTTTYTDSKRLVALELGSNKAKPENYPKHILLNRIDDYVFPMASKITRCELFRKWIFIYPNLHSGINDLIGLKAKNEKNRILLIKFLEEYLQIRIRKQNWATTTADHITLSFDRIANVFGKGAKGANDYLEKATNRVIRKMEHRLPEVEISRNVERRFKAVSNFTNEAANTVEDISKTVSNGIGKLGHMVGNVAHYGGAKTLTALGISKNTAEYTLDNTFAITTALVNGLGSIFNQLTDFVKLIGRSVARNTVRLLRHKYGRGVAAVTNDTFLSVGNCLILIFDVVSNLTPKKAIMTVTSGVFVRETESESRFSDITELPCFGSSRRLKID